MKKSSGVATTEELEMIRDYCLMPYMLQIIEGDRSALEHSYGIKLKDILYIPIDAMHKRIHDDLMRVKRLLKSANIKISDPTASSDGIRCTVWIRGYEQHFCFWREMARSEVKIRLGRYMFEVLGPKR